MAYKRQSPAPILESGTNYSTQAHNNGTIVFDGTGLSSIDPAMSGWVLTSMGAGMIPAFQPLAGSGSSWIGSSPGELSQITVNLGLGAPTYHTSINSAGAVPSSDPTENLFVFPFACTISNLYVFVTGNSAGNTINSFININGSNTSITVSIPSATSGLFTDLIHTTTVMAGDTLALVSNATASPGQVVNGQWFIEITP